MASNLFQSFGTGENHAQVAQSAQTPRDAAISLMKQQGINIPDNISNNPSAIIQHLIQSGAIPQNRVAMAQQMLMQRMGMK